MPACHCWSVTSSTGARGPWPALFASTSAFVVGAQLHHVLAAVPDPFCERACAGFRHRARQQPIRLAAALVRTDVVGLVDIFIERDSSDTPCDPVHEKAGGGVVINISTAWAFEPSELFPTRLHADGFEIGVLSSSGKGEALATGLGGIGVTGSNQSTEDIGRLVDNAISRWGRIGERPLCFGNRPCADTWPTGRCGSISAGRPDHTCRRQNVATQ